MPQTIWSFRTESVRVDLEVDFCPEDPKDHFEFEEDIEAVVSGEVLWFDATVNVYVHDVHVSWDHLGACAYATFLDFVEGHRDSDPMNRNCSVMRAARKNAVVCHYFPDMVRTAVAEARQVIADMKSMPLRAA